MSQQKLTPIQQYRQTMLGLNRQQPINQANLQQRVNELQMLSTNRPKKDIFDMASSLGGGLTRQSQSGRPSSIGYGLSMGFGDFNDQINKNKELAEQEAQQLRMMAYEELKAERERARKIEETVAQNIFETETSALEESSSGLFGTSSTGRLYDIINKIFAPPPHTNSVGKVISGPAFANESEYAIAYNALIKEKSTTDPTGAVIRTKGMDLAGMGFPPPGSYGKPTPAQPSAQSPNTSLAGTTYTKQQMIQNGSVGTNKKTGKKVYISGYDANGNPTYVEF